MFNNFWWRLFFLTCTGSKNLFQWYTIFKRIDRLQKRYHLEHGSAVDRRAWIWCSVSDAPEFLRVVSQWCYEKLKYILLYICQCYCKGCVTTLQNSVLSFIRVHPLRSSGVDCRFAAPGYFKLTLFSWQYPSMPWLGRTAALYSQFVDCCLIFWIHGESFILFRSIY